MSASGTAQARFAEHATALLERTPAGTYSGVRAYLGDGANAGFEVYCVDTATVSQAPPRSLVELSSLSLLGRCATAGR